MDQNLISGTLTPDDVQACKDALDVLFTKMPFLFDTGACFCHTSEGIFNPYNCKSSQEDFYK